MLLEMIRNTTLKIVNFEFFLKSNEWDMANRFFSKMLMLKYIYIYIIVLPMKK